jgi:hypothetical protein
MVQVFIKPTNSFTFSNALFMVGTPTYSWQRRTVERRQFEHRLKTEFCIVEDVSRNASNSKDETDL